MVSEGAWQCLDVYGACLEDDWGGKMSYKMRTVEFFFLLKCLIQLDQRIQYQNAIARNLAHFLNSPQQGEPPSA